MLAFYVKIIDKYFTMKQIIKETERGKVRSQVSGFIFTPRSVTLEGLGSTLQGNCTVQFGAVFSGN